MSFEADLTTALRTVCPRVFPDIAPVGTLRPYITYQALGGRSLRYLDNTPADKRNTLMQVNVWSDRRLEATDLVHQVEEALCGAHAFTARPQGEPIADFDKSASRYGFLQDFSIYSAR